MFCKVYPCRLTDRTYNKYLFFKHVYEVNVISPIPPLEQVIFLFFQILLSFWWFVQYLQLALLSVSFVFVSYSIFAAKLVVPTERTLLSVVVRSCSVIGFIICFMRRMTLPLTLHFVDRLLTVLHFVDRPLTLHFVDRLLTVLHIIVDRLLTVLHIIVERLLTVLHIIVDRLLRCWKAISTKS
jgi:hypothetical protein